MTTTADDLAFALAALDVGATPYQSWHELWHIEHDGVVLTSRHPSLLAALATAGRALGLQPKWVVVPVEGYVLVPRDAAWWGLGAMRALKHQADDRANAHNWDRGINALANALSPASPKDGEQN